MMMKLFTPRTNVATRTHPAVTAVEPDKSRVVVVGGLNIEDGSPLATVQQFDPSKEEPWTDLDHAFPYPIFSASAVSGAEKVYVVGGKRGDTGKTTSALHVLDLKTEPREWKCLTPMKKPRRGCAAVLVSDCIYVFGGYNYEDGLEEYLNTVERYDIKKDEWHCVEHPMSAARYNAAATAAGNKVYVLGGQQGGDASLDKTGEVFDVETETWSPMPNMASRRHMCAAITLSDQFIVVLGGRDDVSGNVLTTAEVYDTTKSTWISAMVETSIELYGFGVAVLQDEKLVAIGGGFLPHGKTPKPVEIGLEEHFKQFMIPSSK